MKSLARTKILLLAFACGLIAAGGEAVASVVLLPSSLARETLSESVPTADSPAPWAVEDFAVEWEQRTPPVPGLEASLVPGSLQWVRVSEVLVLPRAKVRLRIPAAQADAGGVRHASLVHPFHPLKGELRAELSVALIPGSQNPIDVSLRKKDSIFNGKLLVRFKPRAKALSSPEGKVFFDLSCSRFGVQASRAEMKPDQWVYVGCRQILNQVNEERAPTLELMVFWGGNEGGLELAALPTAPVAESTWAIRVQSAPGKLALRAGEQNLELRYRLPERFKAFSLGMGLGPYHYVFQGPNESVSKPAAILTLYGSYFVTESLRFVAFDATSFTAEAVTDFGIYLSAENFKLFDRKISANLMLGGHLLGFRSGGQYFLLFGAPQGVELIWSDAFARGKNLTLGGFIYPKINDKSYDNVWLRWGSRSLFVELNFILWEEMIRAEQVFSRSIGVSVGFPIASF